MNLYDFESMNRLGKLDYIIECLYKAHSLFKIIHDSDCGLEQPLIDELEYLGSEFSRIGIMAEEGYFNGLYEEINKNLSKLSGIVTLVESYIYRHRTLN